jgi:hypothetical protein
MKINLVVHEIPKSQAISFIQKHHYSPVMPRLTKHFLGFFLDDDLVGVLTLGWGTQPRQTIRKMFPALETRDYFEIGKMCMTDEMPRNSESQMMALTVRWLKKNHPNLVFLYTMADGIMGKCGYVYQASNFLYGGSYLTQVYLMENGEKLHPRSTKSLLIENAQMENRDKLFWMTSKYMQHKNIQLIIGHMFRYIYPLNNNAKKLIKNGTTFTWSRNYPKNDSLKWYDGTIKPKKEITQPAFTFDNAIYNRKNIGETTNTIMQFLDEIS